MQERKRLLLATPKVVMSDVDGCFTDGRVIFTDDGSETREFDIKDGMGVTLANQAGLITVLVSGRSSPVITRRARELRFAHCLTGFHDKIPAWELVKSRYSLEDGDLAYLGDDLLDLALLARAGCSFAPSDAVADVRRRVHVVLEHPGGRGAFREMVELMLKARGDWEHTVESYVRGSWRH